MCLDPRPDSLVRARRRLAQEPSRGSSADPCTSAGPAVVSTPWRGRLDTRLPRGLSTRLPTRVDELDARGWTLVWRSAAG
jgi:hypothetical protein